MLSGWIPIALLFASGTVGQTFTELLRSHDHLSHWYRLIKPFWAELDAMTNVTIFVPNNDGVAAYFNTPQSEGCLSTDLDVLRATIVSHLLFSYCLKHALCLEGLLRSRESFTDGHHGRTIT